MFKNILMITGITIFVIITLFAIWLRFFVSEHVVFKHVTLLEHRQGISTDGAYLLYNKDSVRLIKVEENMNDYVIIDQHFSTVEFGEKFIVNAYNYDDPSEISFQVNLMDSILIPQSTYPKADKIFTVSDIEGNFYAFHKLLKANKIIDDNSNWNFGNGHLVLVGDFVDRGLNVTQCLWLIYKLEKQALAYGGSVHFILGNHELNNLNGKNIHVRSKYKKLASRLDLDYSKDFYGTNSELGRWLRTKNTIEKIGDFLFVHGGISNDLLNLKLSIDEINKIVRNNIGSINYPDSISAIIHSKTGPLWYRGFGHDRNCETPNVINNAKQYYKISTIIIGHSTVDNIEQKYNNSLINVDVHFPHKDSDSIRGQGLLIEKNSRFKVDDLGNREKI